MNDHISAMKQALGALENVHIEYDFHGNPADEENKMIAPAITALRQAIEQAEKTVPSDYSNSHQREWVGLTDEEVGGLTVFDGLTHIEVPILADFVRVIEAKLKEKNCPSAD